MIDQTTILTDFRSFYGDRSVPQDAALSYTTWLMASARCAAEQTSTEAEARQVFEDTAARVSRFGVSPRHISRRLLLTAPAGLEADGAPPWPSWLDEVAERPHGATLDDRMALYGRVLEEFLGDAYPEPAPDGGAASDAEAAGENAPDDVVHVSCSGYQAPNGVERLVAARGWRRTAVFNAYHMGCYAALPAVRLAHGLLRGATRPKSRVDLVHSELLSLHGEMLDHSAGNIVTSTLFGDGFIRYSAVSPSAASGRRGLAVRAIEERVVPDSAESMTWTLTPHGFHMYLSPEVPLQIREALPELVEALAEQLGTTRAALCREAVFAVHPGGPRIVQFVQQCLGLDDAQVAHSRAVLYDRGNMSSATLPHIWKALLEDVSVAPGTPVVSLGFGPGLTASGLVFEVCGAAGAGPQAPEGAAPQAVQP